MRTIFIRTLLIALSACLLIGCNAYQPTKNVWKGTKGLWYTYVSPPASVDYEDKGDLSSEAIELSRALMGIDLEMGKLERVMQNADRPPTQEWLTNLFASFPWLNGFAGVKYDGTILGQEPPDSIKQLDFIPLLYEDKKQNSRALRADVQPSPLGPEIMLAAPLYDGMDFLGIVVAYFEMRSLMRFSNNADDIVALSPGALLWAGKYEFAATPLAGVDWEKVVRESSAGTCSNSTGSFFYMVRYIGNLPIVFAIPSKGAFPEGNGDLAQGAAYFPQEREKLPPPPMPERKRDSANEMQAFEKPAPVEEPEPQMTTPTHQVEASDRNVIPAGSRDSVLLKGRQQKAKHRVEERALEGENIEVIRTPERRQRPVVREPEAIRQPEEEAPPIRRPSPFGPQEEEKPEPAYQRPSPFGPREESRRQDTTAESAGAPTEATRPDEAPAPSAAPAQQQAIEKPASGDKPAEDAKPAQEPGESVTLPGGRPSPFGPGK